MKFDIRTIILLVKPFIALGVDPSEHVERAITIPEAKRKELYRGMPDDAVTEAENDFRLAMRHFSQFLTNIATRGTFGADRDPV